MQRFAWLWFLHGGIARIYAQSAETLQSLYSYLGAYWLYLQWFEQ